MSIAVKARHDPEAIDRLVKEVDSPSRWTAWSKEVPLCEYESFPAKASIHEAYDYLTPGNGTYAVVSVGHCIPLDPESSPTAGRAVLWKMSPGTKGCGGLIDLLDVKGIVEMVEAKPNVQVKKVAQAMASRLQELDASVAGAWPDDGLRHPPLKNVQKLHVRLNQLGPLPPRIAYDPDRE